MDSSSASPPASQKLQTPQTCTRPCFPCSLTCGKLWEPNYAAVALHLSDAKMVENCWKRMSGKKPTMWRISTIQSYLWLSVGKLGPAYFGEEKTAKILNNTLLLKLISRFRHIPGAWAYVSEAGYLAEARLTFPAIFLFPQLRSQKKKNSFNSH